ncbi:hypothetical protein C8R48DRAFT_674798 [Suillus tomentosus]|nr:hypothetical protein C8R48DRAFT_674798 [Suillus tomentosus]
MTTIPAVVPQPSFYGDYEKEEEPTNWIRKYQLSLPPSYSDVEKISRFELQCAAASPAEEWFTNLPSTDKTTWTNFLAAFKVRWPPPAHAKLTVAQKKERLKSVVLKEEEIGVMIEKDRGRDWGHVKWAKQVAQMALGFGDTQCHFLDVVLENTPEVLRDFLADHYATWADFKADVAKTSASQLIRAKQRVVNDRKLREDVDKLQTQTFNSRKAPAPSPQNAQSSFPLPPVYRYGPRYAPNTNVTSQPAPPYQTAPPALPNPQPPQPPPAMITPQTPQNPFNAATPVPRTNLFYGYRSGYPQTPSRGRGPSSTDRVRTAAQYAVLPHHPDSEAGRQAYAQQVQDWSTQHGTEAAPNMTRPYPLKPGTSPLGSRECFNCGLATTPSHQAHECQNTPIPMQEGRWREMVSRLVTRSLAPPQTPSTPSSIQYITPMTPQPAQTTTQQYYPSFYAPQQWQYEQLDMSGNAYGPQQ